MLTLTFLSDGSTFQLDYEACKRIGATLMDVINIGKDDSVATIPPEIEEVGFETLLDYCRDVTPITGDNVYQLLEAAAYYGNELVFLECVEFLKINPAWDVTLVSIYWLDRAWVNEELYVRFILRFRLICDRQRAVLDAMRIMPHTTDKFWYQMIDAIEKEMRSYYIWDADKIIGLAGRDGWWIITQKMNGHLVTKYLDHSESEHTFFFGHVFPTKYQHMSYGFYDDVYQESSGLVNDVFMVLVCDERVGQCALYRFKFMRSPRLLTVTPLDTLYLNNTTVTRSYASLILKGTLLYVCGGIDNEFNQYADVTIISLNDGNVLRQKKMKKPRVEARGVVHGDSIYVYGDGIECVEGKKEVVCSSVRVFDAKPLDTNKMLLACRHHQDDKVIDTLWYPKRGLWETIRTKSMSKTDDYITLL